MKTITRLERAQERYAAALDEWLNNPKNEDLPDEVISAELDAAMEAFLQELFLDEEECAVFISAGNIVDELTVLPKVFDRFKSLRIYDAIASNCEVAFSHTFFVESRECEQQRREMLRAMQSQLMK